jgi:hypothetical protein
VKEHYAAEFAQTAALSDEAQSLLINLPAGEEQVSTLGAAVFLERAIRSCQAAILLCESGLVQEA